MSFEKKAEKPNPMKTRKKPQTANVRSLSFEFNLEHVRQLLEATQELAHQGLVSG